MEVEDWPRHELRITATSTTYAEGSIDALLDYLDLAFNVPQVCSGFVLGWDLRKLGRPQMEVLERVVCWSCEPGREAKWHERCKCWKIAVPEGAYFQVARWVLNAFFYMKPPSCHTYLVTNPSGPPGADAVCYTPDGASAETSFMPATESRPADSEWCKAEQMSEVSAAALIPTSTPFTPTGELPPDTIDVGFAEVYQGFDKDRALGYLKILGRDGELSEAGLSQMMDFMDAFVASTNASQGFAITYDLRALRTPSMNMVTRIAEWGAEPKRQATWERLNVACKVVVSAGIRYTLCKGVLCTFFYLCPPVCRTFLLTEPDQSEESATVFEPSPKAEDADAQAAPEQPEASGPPQLAVVVREPAHCADEPFLGR